MATIVLADITEIETVKITELPENTNPGDSDVSPTVQGGVTQKVTKANLLNPAPATHTPAAGSTLTLDLSENTLHFITMPAGNITIAISNELAGQSFSLRILQDSVGSRTITWFTAIKWSEGGDAPVLTTTANKADLVTFMVTGTGAYDGFLSGSNI